MKEKSLLNEVDRLKAQVERLKSELTEKERKHNLELVNKHVSINSGEALAGTQYAWAVKLKSKGMPAVKKQLVGEPLYAMIGAAILSLMGVIMSRTRPITRVKALSKVLFKNFIFGVKNQRWCCIKKYVRSKGFVPWKIHKAMDLAPKGSLNYHGIGTMKQVEVLDKYQQGLLPSSSCVKDQAKKMYAKGQDVCPIVRVDSKLGEMYKFEYEQTLRLILKTFGLYEIAQRDSIEICHTMDGAELCDYMNHLTAGVKIIDKRAIDPCSGKPLCCYTDNLLGFSCQSQNFCFIIKSLIGKDTKENYNHFADFF
jgi:hypothetical protein